MSVQVAQGMSLLGLDFTECNSAPSWLACASVQQSSMRRNADAQRGKQREATDGNDCGAAILNGLKVRVSSEV
eukprot:3827377-Rhodomonas_salina.1